MKKIFPLFLALTVLTGCNEETELTPGLTPVGGVISLRSESVLKNEPAAKAATSQRDGCRTTADLHLRGMDKGRQSPMRTA